MSYETRFGSTLPGRVRDRFGVPQLLATTLVLVAGTILLGVAAKATGSGLACEANWPQCDAGPFNLFPASLPSFYEWIHRFVAMFAGVAIVTSALTAWLSTGVSRRVSALVALGTVLTPVQVLLGRETVLQYRLEILSLHFWTAIAIFTAFALATVLVWKASLTRRHLRVALAAGVVAVPAHVALSPLFITDITTYSPEIQTAQYAVTLTLITTLVVAGVVGHWRFDRARVRTLLAATIGLGSAVIVLGRRAVMTFVPALDFLYVAAALALALAFVVAIWATGADRTASRSAI